MKPTPLEKFAAAVFFAGFFISVLCLAVIFGELVHEALRYLGVFP